MSAVQLTFDEDFGAAIDRAIRRLNALASEVSERLGVCRSSLADHRALAECDSRECACDEESLIASLVVKGTNGDAEAMEALIARYQPRVAGFVLACVNEGQAVEDLCQTIFYKMLLGLPRLKAVEKFESWLFRIARNACFDYLRRRRLRRIFLPWKETDDQFAVATDLAPDSERERRADAFRLALMKLPKKQRELVALLQDDRLSYERLAEITNTTVGSVKARLFRARRQLRESMRDDR